MEDVSSSSAIQLDKEEREDLERTVTQLRERAEQTIRHWITAELNLESKGAKPPARLDERQRTLRKKIEKAIDRERAGGQSWAEARQRYVKGVGYTLVNRLAALRCMEVRGFIDESATRFRDSGVTPAADRLINNHFMETEASVWTAFLQACQARAEEIELLFDLSDPYSLLYGDLAKWSGEAEDVTWSGGLRSDLVELLRSLCTLLDEVDDAVWGADDVLGWVYEYYNTPDLDAVRKKARRGGLDPEDVPSANQFYTPHWVVRMLVDNSLGKLYLEREGALQETVQNQANRFTPDERKRRDAASASSIEELCTYLVAAEEEGEATDFEHPSEIRVFDPACGSGHFLLYAFDVLERIWWDEAPEIPRSEVPAKILHHNLYGVDLDLRACQLAAFNLYLKARSRAEKHGADDFSMPSVGIVCADAHVADLDRSHQVFGEVAAGNETLRDALGSILTAFEQVEGLGSLLDVKGTLAELVDDVDGQLNIFEDADAITLPELLGRLHETVADHTNGASFRAKDLRSFLRLLVILSQDYDVALMNPPYGRGGRMPDAVQDYVEDHYAYSTQYYINFFELNQRLSKPHGRIGMLVPKSFMYKTSYSAFREDFVSGEGAFDFLADFGKGILDKAAVSTAGTIVNLSRAQDEEASGRFYRLHDVEKKKKERSFLQAAYVDAFEDDIQRRYVVPLQEFEMVPGSSLSYWVPTDLRRLYQSEQCIEAREEDDRESVGVVRQGIATGDDDRYVHFFWEHNSTRWKPLAKGGEDSWLLPRVQKVINWKDKGYEIKRYSGGNGTPSEHHYFKPSITYNRVKSKSGRRFGVLRQGAIFGDKGPVIIPSVDAFEVMAFANSTLATYLMLAQTSSRMWEISEVSKLPWFKELTNVSLQKAAKKIIALIASLRQFEFTSPYYGGPFLLALLGQSQSITSHRRHPHRFILDESTLVEPEELSPSISISEFSEAAADFQEEVKSRIKDQSEYINRRVFDLLDLSDFQRDLIRQELSIRYGEAGLRPFRDEEDNGQKDEVDSEHSFNTEKLVKRLLLHLSFEIMEEDDDGIVLLRAESDEEEADLLAKMTAKFAEIWGEHAEDRLQEVDEVLGSRKPTDETYPNLRHWLENDLFAFHCSEFENTPILWKLTTERLSDSRRDVTGFACLVDYHQMDAGVFDRLSARYLEARKAALTEREESAAQTAGNDTVSGQRREQARKEAERCRIGLKQIDIFEDKVAELAQDQPREWAAAVQDTASELEPKVRCFRERLEERLATIDTLHEETPTSWFKEHFADKFKQKVDDNREEWIDALKDLEAACEQFARPADKPVEAHLYDLLPYFEDLTGSTHFASNGIFFLNYYFSKEKELAAKVDRGEADRLPPRKRRLAELARETEEDIRLGGEILGDCQELQKHIDSDWKARALEEVQTAGYDPVKKHGVAINITPLAEKKIVPARVENDVL
jgi:type I restriction-modification system DNA methylase subunit